MEDLTFSYCGGMLYKGKAVGLLSAWDKLLQTIQINAEWFYLNPATPRDSRWLRKSTWILTTFFLVMFKSCKPFSSQFLTWTQVKKQLVTISCRFNSTTSWDKVVPFLNLVWICSVLLVRRKRKIISIIKARENRKKRKTPPPHPLSLRILRHLSLKRI